MKTVYTIFAIVFALMAGYFIQRAGEMTGFWPTAYYAIAIYDAGLCFALINKKENE